MTTADGHFNFAMAEVRARAAGVSLRDFCRRAQRASVAARMRKRREAARALEVSTKRWDLKNDL